MSMTRKGMKPEFVPAADDVAKYRSLKIYFQIFYWKMLMEKDIDPTLWGWHIKEGASESIVRKAYQCILMTIQT